MGATVSDIIQKLTFNDQAKVVEQLDDQLHRVHERLAHVEHTIAIMSGKGGVGKSTITVQLALALARLGKRVGIVDVDLNGPCIAEMLDMSSATFSLTKTGALPPVGPLGIKIASIDFFLREKSPVRWQGPAELSPVWLGAIEMNAVREMLSDVEWGTLDFLLADLPPGAAADKPPLLVKLVPNLLGAIMVTTPSPIAIPVVERSLAYIKELGIKPLGLIENMSTHVCRRCGGEDALFAGNVIAMSQHHDLPVMASIPFVSDLTKVAPQEMGEEMKIVRERMHVVAQSFVNLTSMPHLVATYL